MASVTSIIKEIKQPRGGYLPIASFDRINLFDDNILHKKENIHASLVGLAVDYLSRMMLGTNSEDAFGISMKGAKISSLMYPQYYRDARCLLNNISGLDDNSIVNACKLVSFDVWYRSPDAALSSRNYRFIDPDNYTISNIRVLVKRCESFWKSYGPIVKDGFSFEPNGYTSIVSAGDGDFLTKDCLWDLKVTKKEVNSKHTLQILMYWIMGKHSGNPIFNNIRYLGFYNPRRNIVYRYDTSLLDKEIIGFVENSIICYKKE